MQTDAAPYSQPDYQFTARNSRTGWIVAHNSQITRVAVRNSNIVGLAFHRHSFGVTLGNINR